MNTPNKQAEIEKEINDKVCKNCKYENTCSGTCALRRLYEEKLLPFKTYEQGIKEGRTQAISEFKEKLIRLIDENLIGYNQFNSVGEMSRMVEVTELKERIEKTAQEIK